MSKNRNKNQLSLFDEIPIDEIPKNLTNEKIQGDTVKEKLNYIHNNVYCEPTVSLDEYCEIIYEWLRINSSTYTVLDFFEDNNNIPFEYTMEDVMSCPRISLLLEQRIGRDGMNGRLRGTLTSTLLQNKFNWVDKNVKTELTVDSNEPIQFEFGQ